MFLANYLNEKDEPASLDEIERTSLSSSALEFEETTGLNPFEMSPDEVDLYRPDVYKILSDKCQHKTNLCFKKAHDAYVQNRRSVPLFPAEVSKAAIYFVRNPLDVCISYANHSGGKIPKNVSFLINEEAQIAGKRTGQLRQLLLSWTSHAQSWLGQDNIPVHLVRYEDMLRDTEATFKGIVNFLGLAYNEDKLKNALNYCNFKTLQKMESKNGFREKTQACKKFFWKGEIGYYRDFLSQEQIKRIVDYNRNSMLDFGYIDKDGNLTV